MDLSKIRTYRYEELSQEARHKACRYYLDNLAETGIEAEIDEMRKVLSRLEELLPIKFLNRGEYITCSLKGEKYNYSGSRLREYLRQKFEGIIGNDTGLTNQWFDRDYIYLIAEYIYSTDDRNCMKSLGYDLCDKFDEMCQVIRDNETTWESAEREMSDPWYVYHEDGTPYEEEEKKRLAEEAAKEIMKNVSRNSVMSSLKGSSSKGQYESPYDFFNDYIRDMYTGLRPITDEICEDLKTLYRFPFFYATEKINKQSTNR